MDVEKEKHHSFRRSTCQTDYAITEDEVSGLARDNFLYMRIYEDVKRRIEEKEYAEGTKLPSDEELMTRFGVSMITVKKALSMLRDEGLLQRIPGVGTIVVKQTGGGDAQPEDTEIREIGIVMEHVSSSFGLDLVYRIDQKAEENGYKTLLRFSYYNREKETGEISYLVRSGIAGLIVMPCHGVYYNPEILKLILEGFPVVVIDKKLEGISVPSVRTDNREAVIGLVRQLAEQGCRKPGFFSTEIVGTSSLLERRNGFYEAAKALSLNPLPECALAFDRNIFDHRPAEDNVDRVMRYLQAYRGQIDGIVCAEYSMMPAILEASARMDARVGTDIRICCVDGPETLPIPHMKQDETKMADIIVELLLSQINGTCKEKDFLVPALLKTDSRANALLYELP